MKKIYLAQGFNYVAVFLTLRCNFSCKYCINDRGNDLVIHRKELNADQWIEGINRLVVSNDIAITMSGGEPTIHKDFYKIVQEIYHPIDLLTNFQFDVYDFINNVDPRKMFHNEIEGYKSVRVSFHPDFMSIKEVVSKAVALQDAGFHVGILPINFPHSTKFNLRLAEEARKNMVYTFIKDYLGEYEGKIVGHYKYPEAIDRKMHDEVLCRTNEVLISPSGQVYKCHRDMYTDEYPLGSLLYEDFKLRHKFRECSNYGFCNYCDIKNKVNRFLEMGACSVEIRHINGTY